MTAVGSCHRRARRRDGLERQEERKTIDDRAKHDCCGMMGTASCYDNLVPRRTFYLRPLAMAEQDLLLVKGEVSRGYR